MLPLIPRAFLLFFSPISCLGTGIMRCSQQDLPTQARKYHFASPCARSSAKVIARARISSFDICQRFASRFKGFALNFMHREYLFGSANFTGDTCLVYDCPEFDVHTYTARDTLYDYYTSYARPMPQVNATCVPYLGLFQLQRTHKNYSEAAEICQADGGRLSTITNEFHTVQLASLLRSAKVREAFVGLEQFNKEDFLTQSGLPLSCIKYRAWAPGEPKPIKEQKCVAITSGERWKAVACKRRMAFICELTPAGPYRPCGKIKKPRRKKVCVERFKKIIPRPGRYPKCGDPLWATVTEAERRSERKQMRNQTRLDAGRSKKNTSNEKTP